MDLCGARLVLLHDQVKTPCATQNNVPITPATMFDELREVMFW